MSNEEVAEHYNAVPNAGIGARTQSRIFYMRNMNNFLKSMLINETVNLLKKEAGVRDLKPSVLDIACGKGGDLRKWFLANPKNLVMADIADVSIEQAQSRYEEQKNFKRGNICPAQFHVIDATKEELHGRLAKDVCPFDISSCQFALHYSFSSEAGAKMFLKNCVQDLRPGGYFVGTLPDADRIVWACRQGGGTFSNSVCTIRFDEPKQLEKPPLFGATFHFALHEQVNCPEYLAYFPLLVKILDELGMELVFMRRFPDAVTKYQNEDRGLMGRMQALEPYPPAGDVNLMGEDVEYDGAKQKKEELGDELYKGIGTLSKSEWEAVSMYLMFAFRKRSVEGEKEEVENVDGQTVDESVKKEEESADGPTDAKRVRKEEESTDGQTVDSLEQDPEVPEQVEASLEQKKDE